VSILDKIRSLFGGEDIPEDAERIYRMSKSETEALSRLEAERGRSDRHRGVLIEDVRVLAEKEEGTLEAGKKESSSVKRRILAKEVAEVRGRIDDLMNRIDLLTRRVALFDRQIALVRDKAVLAAPIPEREEIESAAEDALVARREFEERADLGELYRDVSRISGGVRDEDAVLAEIEGHEEEELSFEDMVRQEERKARPTENEGGREALME